MYKQGIEKIILGTAGLGGVWGKVNTEESITTIVDALSRGICALDTAPAYGDAEEFVGQAMARWSGARPIISTKVGRLKSYRSDQAEYDYTNEGMNRCVDNSLKTLGIEQVDVLFLHEPAVVPCHEIEQVVMQMQYFKEQGYAKKIGIGGNLPKQFEPFLQDDVFDVIMEYNRLNACSIDALHTTIPACAHANKAYYAASPLNMGLLGCSYDEFLNFPPNWLDSKSIEQAERINAIAERYALPLDVLALRFLYNIPASFKVVLGAADKDQLMSSLRAVEAGVLPDDIYNEILQTLN